MGHKRLILANSKYHRDVFLESVFIFDLLLLLKVYHYYRFRYKMLAENTWPNYRRGDDKEGVREIMKVCLTMV